MQSSNVLGIEKTPEKKRKIKAVAPNAPLKPKHKGGMFFMRCISQNKKTRRCLQVMGPASVNDPVGSVQPDAQEKAVVPSTYGAAVPSTHGAAVFSFCPFPSLSDMPVFRGNTLSPVQMADPLPGNILPPLSLGPLYRGMTQLPFLSLDDCLEMDTMDFDEDFFNTF